MDSCLNPPTTTEVRGRTRERQRRRRQFAQKTSALAPPPQRTRTLEEISSEIHALLHAVLIAVPPPSLRSDSCIAVNTSFKDSAEKCDGLDNIGTSQFNTIKADAAGTSAIESIQREAVAVITEGFGVFYPSDQDRLCLLEAIIAHASGNASPKESRSAVSPVSTLKTAGLESPLSHPALLRALLSQVLQDRYIAPIVTSMIYPICLNPSMPFFSSTTSISLLDSLSNFLLPCVSCVARVALRLALCS